MTAPITWIHRPISFYENTGAETEAYFSKGPEPTYVVSRVTYGGVTTFCWSCEDFRQLNRVISPMMSCSSFGEGKQLCQQHFEERN